MNDLTIKELEEIISKIDTQLEEDLTEKKRNELLKMKEMNLKKIEEKLPQINLKSASRLKNEEFNKSNNFMNHFYNDLSIYEIRVINSLLYVFDTYNNIHKDSNTIQTLFNDIIYKDGFFKMKYQDLLKIMKIRNTDITLTEIKRYLRNIRSKDLEYYKEEERSDGKKIVINNNTSFILKFDIETPLNLFGEKVLNETYIKFYIDKELYKDIFKLHLTARGYTKNLNINMNKLSSRLGLGLYEELSRITPLKVVKKKQVSKTKFKDNHNYTLDQLNLLFGTNFKYMSYIKRNVISQYKKILKFELLEDNYKFEFSKEYMTINIKRDLFKEYFKDVCQF